MLLLSTIFTLNVRNSTNINLTKYLIIMKNLLTVLALMIGLMSCGNKENSSTAKSPEKNRV